MIQPKRMSVEDLTRMRKWVDAIGDNPYERHTTGADAADRLLSHIAALSSDLEAARARVDEAYECGIITGMLLAKPEFQA